jgi:HSP20 family protein
MAIIRWNQLQDINKFFDELSALTHNGRDLATDVYEENGNIVVEMHVAGIEPDKVDINVEGDNLRVTGSREEEYETEDRNYYRKEIRHGSFERLIRLPAPVAAEQTRAEVDNGVLKILLPKQVKAQPRKVKVESKVRQKKTKKETV